MKIVYQWLRDLVDVPRRRRRRSPPRSRCAASRSPKSSRAALPVIDFEITANRPDCLNHLGIAREASVIWNTPLKAAAPAPAAPAGDVTVDVELADAALCPRYCAQVFDVRIGPSPAWLAERLEAAGVRPINNIVDVTNYVMLEMGQPMHAFDLQRLRGGRLVIRRAAAGETLQTLDGVERTLDQDMLVIADARARGGGRRRDGRTRLRDPRRHHADGPRERVFPSAVGAPDEQAAWTEDRGVDPLRARRRRQRAAGRHRPGGGAVRADWRRPRRRSADRSLSRSPRAGTDRAARRAHRPPARSGGAGRGGARPPAAARLRPRAKRRTAGR